MSTEVIQPAPGQTVITTDHRNHDRHHHGDGRFFDAVEARADYRSLTAEVERFGTQNLASAARTNELVQAGACRTDQIVQAGFGDAARDTCAATKDVTAAVNTAAVATALAACKTDDGVQLVGKDAVTLAKDGLIALQVAASGINSGVNTGFAAQSVLATTIGNAQAVLSNAIGNAAAVQATANYNGLTVLGERIRAELGAKQDSWFAAATLVAFQNKADSDAKAAKCCCDADATAARNFAALSALIVSDGNMTRALINQNTIDDLRAFKASIPRGIAITVPVTA
jgi:hypothetical protein